jgi:hypothetical protein
LVDLTCKWARSGKTRPIVNLNALGHGSSRGGGAFAQPRVVAAATSEDNSKGQLLTTTKRRTSSAYRTLTHPPLSSQATWWPWEGRSCGSTSRKRLETKLDVQKTWLGLRCTPACLRSPSYNVVCAPHGVPHGVNQTAAPSVLSHACRQPGRSVVSCCILPLSVAHTDATLTRPHSLRHPLPPLHTHTHHPRFLNICLPTTRAMQGNDEDHSGAHCARQSTQVQARYHAREEWQQAAGHRWRRTHRKTGCVRSTWRSAWRKSDCCSVCAQPRLPTTRSVSRLVLHPPAVSGTHRCYAHTTALTAPPTAAPAHAHASPSFSQHLPPNYARDAGQ